MRFYFWGGILVSLTLYSQGEIPSTGISLPTRETLPKENWERRRGGRKSGRKGRGTGGPERARGLGFVLVRSSEYASLPPPLPSVARLAGLCPPFSPSPWLSFHPPLRPSLPPSPGAEVCLFTARSPGVRGAGAACRSSRCRPGSRRRRASAAGSPGGSSVSLSASDCKTKP